LKARALAPWLQAAVAGAAVISIADAVIRLQRAAVIGPRLHGSATGIAAIAAADRRVSAISRASLVWLAVAGILFMVWTGLAYADLARSGGRHRFHPAIAAIGPLIPFANLVIAPAAMDDLARQSRFRPTPRVGWWFGTWLVAGVAQASAVVVLAEATLVNYQRSDRIRAVGDVIEVVAAILLVGLVALVTARATARRAEVEAQAGADSALDPVAVGGAPGWYRDPRRQAEVRWWDGLGWTMHVAGSRAAPPPAVRVEPPPAVGARAMPTTALLSLYAGVLALLLVPAPFALALGLWARRDLGRRPGAPGGGRAWFAVISGGIFTGLLVLALALAITEG
jgi:hypothetical protein